MTSAEIRQKFLDFFASKGHTIVPSAPIVVKNDPTLMFTNAGMNQFKDWFLGNETPKYKRVADTQKCLRVSGKHNDLEEVGVDTYHHTMFEMLGNWSFGDYFKTEAIEWAWELLTKEYGLDKDRLYVTYFEGDEKEGLAPDLDALNEWKKWIAEDRILKGNKKDNFWEMGDTGPCGPCSEIHIDLRSEEERKKVDGKTLVNNDHPQVIEIWNNVFMEFNRKADGSLEKLPAQHVDTGMGFERLVRAIEGKSSNYDTDVFVPTIKFIEQHSGIAYGFSDSKQDIAMRVLADHIRAISFAIADGQLPSNNGAGYVIRRILRRAVRYQYQFLNIKEPFLCKLAVLIADSFKNVFPELFAQKDFVVKVIKEEEQSFLKTLGAGINELYSSIEEIQKTQREIEKQLEASKKVAELYAENNKQLEAVNSFKSSVLSITQSLAFKYQGSFDSLNKAISNIDDITKAAKLVGDFKPMLSGSASFILQDEKGFPIDLTRLISKEKGIDVDIEGFEAALQQQKERSRKATELTTDDWVPGRPDSLGAGVHDNTEEHYSRTESQQQNYITQYRKVTKGKETQYQLVIMDNIFYPEGGGQVGDVGKLVFVNETIEVINTIKENGLPILIVNKLPDNPKDYFQAFIDVKRRQLTANNHSATHLLHAALRKVLGTHVQQKGSLVNHEYLRFDFAHFSAMTEEELAQVEHLVNEKIRENIIVHTDPKVAISDAQKMGAMMLFGEKYGEVVRVVTMDENYSRELCGGTHVKATGQIGYFKIVSESAVAAGVRRIEAITADAAETLINQQFALVNELKDLLKAKDLAKSVEQLLQEKAELSKKLEAFEAEKTVQLKNELKQKVTSQSNGNVLIERVTVSSAEQLKNLSFQLRNEIENLFCVLGCELNGKPMLSVMISDNLVADNKLHAGNIVKELAKHIQGGGGGQPFYATAGGNNSNGLADALAKAKTILA